MIGTRTRGAVEEFQRLAVSSALQRLALEAHGDHYVGQTSSAHLQEILAALRSAAVPSAAHVLDAGCGNGCFALALAQRGYFVHGIDLSPALVETARQESRRLGIEDRVAFTEGDFGDPAGLPAFVDCVLSVGSFYWDLDIRETLVTWDGLLYRPGAIILFLNVEVQALTEKEQDAIGRTRFVKESVLLRSFGDLGFRIELKDLTARYQTWLMRWCQAMSRRRKDLANEMPEDKVRDLERRFHAYLALARSRKVKRLRVVARKTSTSGAHRDGP